MKPEPIFMTAPHPNTEIANMLEGRRSLTIAGERLNVRLLRRFYARHDFAPVWTDREAKVDALAEAVFRAGDQGLDPELFHASALRRRSELPRLDRELLLSDAFMSYADALARGAVPVERRRGDETLSPEPINVAAALDSAIHSRDPAAAIESLAPDTPAYRGLLEALQQARAAGGKGAVTRLRQIAVNLERQRWLPRAIPEDRAWVNIADQRLVLYRDGHPVFTTRVVVGEDIAKNQSPEFHTMINASYFNPPWVIPSDIATAEVLPLLRHDPNYLKRNKMVLLANGDVEQLPGPEAGLGYIMFDMPNKFDVYLHDTPDRYIFNRDNRRLSHGCIRVQNPRELAALLMDEPVDAINKGIAKGGTTRHELPDPVPVYVVYQTAFVDNDGTVQFRPDFYGRDAAVWQQLQAHPQDMLPPARPQERHPALRVENHPSPRAARHG